MVSFSYCKVCGVIPNTDGTESGEFGNCPGIKYILYGLLWHNIIWTWFIVLQYYALIITLFIYFVCLSHTKENTIRCWEDMKITYWMVVRSFMRKTDYKAKATSHLASVQIHTLCTQLSFISWEGETVPPCWRGRERDQTRGRLTSRWTGTIKGLIQHGIR